MKKIISVIILFTVSILNAQNNADEIVKNLLAKLDKVNAYTADVTIKVDVDFVNIKDRKAKVIYQKPDKFEINADGFALLPKNASNLEHIKLLREAHTAIYQGEETVGSNKLAIIKIIPSSSDSKVVLAELWVDTQKNNISKMKTYTKNDGTFSIDFSYSDHPFDLPDKVKIEFEISSNKIPSYMTGQVGEMKKDNKEEQAKGIVILDYENYNVK